MRKGCRKHAVKQSLKRVTAVKIILPKKTTDMIKKNHVMTTAVHHVLPVILLLRLRFQKIYIWNYLITKRIRIPSSIIQILIFQTV